MDIITLDESAIGVHLNSARGIYLTRDAIQLAQGYGFIIGPFEQFAIDMFEDHDGEQSFPFEGLQELCDDAIAWLNSGQSDCVTCGGTGIPPVLSDEWYTHKDRPNERRCRPCSGTGRGDRIKFQNFPPIIPDGTRWAFEDGDFGLWKYDDEGMVTE